MAEWISVEDQLPGLGKRTEEWHWWWAHGKRKSVPIVARFTFPDGDTKTMTTEFRTSLFGSGFSLGILQGYDTRYFTHWMPLPTPPTDKEQK